jgi:PPOX class probable F420-dependent enzyme
VTSPDLDIVLASRDFRAFWSERHLCTVSSVSRRGGLHVVPMGVVVDFDTATAWAITSGTSVKVRNLREDPTIAICQVDGRHWSTLQGTAEVRSDPDAVEEAVRRYAARYRQPRPNPARVALRIAIGTVLGNVC